MATAYIIGDSALFFWRQQAHAESILKQRVADPLVDCPRSSDDLKALRLSAESFGCAPIQLMADCMQNRVLKNRFSYAVHSHDLPPTAFCRVSNSICVASPEFCLAQSSRTYSLVRLAELCMELCGRYSLAPTARRGFINREKPLSSFREIKALLSGLHSVRTTKRLNNVLHLCAEGSRSPMETREFLFLCLPKRYGGYGLPRPQLNARVDLSKSEQRVSERRYFECDMHWPEQKVVVEYDGHVDHESYDARANDAIKRNILANKGYKVFTVTGRQIRDAALFDKAAQEIASTLKYRLRAYPQDWSKRREALRRELFKSLISI